MKTALITGANSGLGFEIARKVAAQPGWRVVLACRNAGKAADAKQRIEADVTGATVETISLDTSSLASARACADAVAAAGWRIDALVNNAGISPMGRSGSTGDGFELVFATNYLGHHLLTRLLLPRMAPDARIYSVASDMHDPPGGLVSALLRRGECARALGRERGMDGPREGAGLTWRGRSRGARCCNWARRLPGCRRCCPRSDAQPMAGGAAQGRGRPPRK